MSKKRRVLRFLGRRRSGSFVQGTVVVVLSVCMLSYLSLLQAYQIFYLEGMAGRAGWLQFAGSLAKCAVMVTAMALLWYFYATQEYHTAINELLEIFAVPKRREENQNPYATNQELDFLVQSASGVMRTNKLYRSQLDAQKDLLLKNYLMRLMKGRVRDIPGAYESGEALGVNIRSANLQVFVVGIAGSEEGSLKEEQIQEVYEMVEILAENMLFVVFQGHSLDMDGMLAGLLYPQFGERLDSQDSVVELKRIASLIVQIVQDKTDILLRVAFGSVSAGISGIEKSFSEAMETFQYAEIMKENEMVQLYRELPSVHRVDTDDYFWFKKEMQFMNCINTGDYSSAAMVFDEILDSDYLNGGLPLKLVNCRMLGLINAMINALGKIRLTVDADFFEKMDPWQTILNCTSLPELKTRSKEIFNRINHYTENQKRQSTYNRVTEIVEYLKENFRDPNLGVSAAADAFHLNPSYLSRIFKKLMGVGFSDYLQWLRVEEAKRLLQEKQMSIKEAAEQAGYSSVQTMNRAFKKYEGTTAGKLKNTEGNGYF